MTQEKENWENGKKVGVAEAYAKVREVAAETLKAIDAFSGEGFVSPEMKSFAKISIQDLLKEIERLAKEGV